MARAYAISKLGWIREQQQKMQNQARETPRQYIERESHTLWGRHYLLTIAHRDAKPSVKLDHKHITLTVRPDSDPSKRAQVIHEWHRSILHEAVPRLTQKWEPKLEVKVARYFLQRMKGQAREARERCGVRIHSCLPFECMAAMPGTGCLAGGFVRSK